MVLDELPEGRVADEMAPGFVLRPAQGADADALVELDAAAFPTSWLTIDAARELVARATVLRLIEDTASARIVGFLQLRDAVDGAGYVSDVAVHPEYQRRGLGEGAMRWALAWFRERGLGRAQLTVNTDNAPAIALYRKLGFAPGEVGLDYRRPVDEDEVRQVLEKRLGAHIRVRRR
jgi:ribosomal protein S18 acetylase RimI-like enzyme